jgi:hypothetical protein
MTDETEQTVDIPDELKLAMRLEAIFMPFATNERRNLYEPNQFQDRKIRSLHHGRGGTRHHHQQAPLELIDTHHGARFAFRREQNDIGLRRGGTRP